MTDDVRHRFGVPPITAALLALAGSWQIYAAAGWMLGGHHWLLDLVNNGPQYTVLAGVAAVALAAAQRAWRLLMVFAVVTTPHLVRWSTPSTATTNPGNGETITLLLANVLSSNTDRTPLLDLIERESPDVIGLLEVTDAWLEDLGPVRDGWPTQVELGRSDNFGIAAYTRLPADSASESALGSGIIPTLRIALESGVTIWVTHPVPPIGKSYAAERDAQLIDVANVLAADPLCVVVGDFNATPWSHAFPPSGGGNRVGTFPSQLPSVLRAPIDHVLVGDGLFISDMRVGPHVGSDHRPLIVEFGLR